MASHLEFHAPAFGKLVMHNAPLERLAGGLRWSEGPVWLADMQTLLFSDIPNDRVMAWSEGGGAWTHRSAAGFPNGHARDAQGRLIECSHGLRAVTRRELDGTLTVLADRYDGRRLNSPNDVIVAHDDAIWFTDPVYGIASDYEGERQQSELPCRAYRLDPQSAALAVVAEDLDGPNGLCFSPNGKKLYISDTGTPGAVNVAGHIRSFAVEGDARLSGGEVFYTPDAGVCDGFRCDEFGNLWTSAGDGVHCVSAEGQLLGKIKVPEPVANVAFGGRGRSRLFICAASSLYAVHLTCRGVGSY